jgi:hypothetical protein
MGIDGDPAEHDMIKWRLWIALRGIEMHCGLYMGRLCKKLDREV